MKERSSNLDIEDKVDRLNGVKLDLEDTDYSNITDVLKDHTMDASFVVPMKEEKLIKNIDKVWHWIGGAVTKKLAERVYKKRNDRTNKLRKSGPRKSKKQNTKINKKTNQEENPVQLYTIEDVMEMIHLFRESVGDIKRDIDGIKVKMFDFDVSIQKFKSEIITKAA